MPSPPPPVNKLPVLCKHAPAGAVVGLFDASLVSTNPYAWKSLALHSGDDFRHDKCIHPDKLNMRVRAMLLFNSPTLLLRARSASFLTLSACSCAVRGASSYRCAAV